MTTDKKLTEKTSETMAEQKEIPKKKLVIIGLPSKTETKTGFGNADDRPGYKAKSSKKTGAKYRVRQ